MSIPRDRLVIPGGPRVIQEPDGSVRLVGVEQRTIDLKQTGTPAGQYRVKPLDVMMAAARMRRDGASREAIRKELDLLPHVTNEQLDRFLDASERLLNERIAQGIEPAESVHKVLVETDEGDDDEA